MIVNIYDKPLLSSLDLVYDSDTITLISIVRINDDGDESEVHYSLSKEATERMIKKHTFDGFVTLLKSQRGIKEVLELLKEEKAL